MRRISLCCSALALFCYLPLVQAGVEIGGTRVVYDGKMKQATIGISNPDDKPYLIQSWVNKDPNSDDNGEMFMTTPPLFRLEPHSHNTVRITYTGNALPQDRESVYWLNIKSIPSTDKNATNDLMIAVKNTMKLFYRPAGLPGDPATAYQKIDFKQRDGKLFAFNPTAYSVSFYDVKVNGAVLKNVSMVLPKQEISLGSIATRAPKISWRAINDFGGISEEQQVKL